jgi:predicted ester cyclase
MSDVSHFNDLSTHPRSRRKLPRRHLEPPRQFEDSGLVRDNFTFRGSLGQAKVGHEGVGTYVDFVHSALASYRCDILDLVVEDSKAFARMRFSGIHRGEFFGYQPTGKLVEWLGSALFSFDGEKVADLWVLGDVHGLLQLLEKNANG